MSAPRSAGTVERADLAVSLDRIVGLANNGIRNRLCGGARVDAAGWRHNEQQREEKTQNPRQHLAMSTLVGASQTLDWEVA